MEFIIVHNLECSEILWLESIIYCSAEGSYTRVFLNNGRSVFSSKNLAWFEKNINSKNFVRLHRSYILNLRFIAKVFKNESKVGLQTGEKIPLSKEKSDYLWSAIHQLRNN